MSAGVGDPNPTFVADIHLELAHPFTDLPVPGGYASALGILRLHDVPLGTVPLPIASGRISAAVLHRAIVDRAAEPILRHLLVDRLMTHGVASIGDEPARLLDTPHPKYSGPWPSATVAICTRGRPDDLRRCLAALVRIDYPTLDLLVVDNAPTDSSVADFVRDSHPQVRYVSEPRAGLDWARNRAILESTSDVVAFTDDDAVADPGWLKALVTPLAEEPDTMVVAGLVMPYELETEAQQAFERHGGLGRGFVCRRVRVPRGEKVLHGANVTTLGTGANMAFRRSLFERVGGFDPALGAGTASAAGDEVEMFFRALKAGHTVAYEPSALVCHRHRRDYASVRTQLCNWLMGTYAAAERTAQHYPDERMPIIAFGARLLLLYFPRRLATATFASTLNLDLVLSELRGLLTGRGRYDAAQREAEAIAARFPAQPTLPMPDRIEHRREALALRPMRKVAVSLDEPLPQALPGPDDADRVQVQVLRSSRTLGTIEIVSGGAPVTRRRLSEAIASAHLSDLADLARFREALRALSPERPHS